ncbi:MAG: tetratricopeptide repeat protein [Gallionella sp.]|jgi:hypothetical protein
MTINRSWIFVVLLLAAVTALYGQFLWNPIVFDDVYFFIIDNEGKQPVSSYHWSLLELRSLPYATIAWTAKLLGLDLINFRVEALLLHAVVGVALFFFVLQLYRQVPALGVNGEQKLPVIWLAFFAALLFVLHPVAVYGAGYLIQRTIVMATLFSLLAMQAYLHGSVRHQPLWLWASVPLYYLAVFCKEHAIMLPAVLLALTMLLHEDWRAKLKQRWGIFAVFAAIALFVLLARKGVLGSVYEINAPEMLEQIDGGAHSYMLSILTQSALFFKYLALWLVPNPAWMSVDMREPFAQGVFSVYGLALLAYFLYGLLAIRLLFKRGRAGLIGFALLFPWLMFMTEFTTVRVQESFVLYRSYLWMAGLLVIVPLLFLKMRARPALAALSLISVLMMLLAWDRLTTFSHPLLLWDDAAKLVEGRPYLPGMERIYHNRGISLSKTRLKQEAIADYTTAIRMRPNYGYVYNDRGVMYLELQRYAEAMNDFETAIRIKPDYSLPYIGRGVVLKKFGRQEEARQSFGTACVLGYQSACAELNRPGVTEKMEPIFH